MKMTMEMWREREITYKYKRMAWLDIPIEVARDLVDVRNKGRDIKTLIAATRCLALDITIDREGDTQQMLMAALVWDTRAVNRMERIIEGMTRDLPRRVHTTLYYARQEEARTKAMEGDM